MASAAKNCAPHLQKVWKSYTFQQGVTTRTVSPFNVNVIGSLFRDAGSKLQHKVVDNFWDVFPGVAGGVAVVAGTVSARKSYLMSHRH